MADRAVFEALHHLGIDRDSYKVIALLPLVQTAWADGKVQTEEREVILRIARDHVRLGGEGERVLENWLTFEPSTETKIRGNAIISALLPRKQGFGATLVGGEMQDVLGLCEEVAKAAGKLFGLVSVMTGEEKKALEEIGATLQAARSSRDLDDPPTDVVEKKSSSPTTGMGPVLTIHGDGDGGEAYLVRIADDPLVPQGEIVTIDQRLSVGRGAENHLQISNDGLVSRVHCIIRFDGGKYYVRDKGSTNGTVVNGDLVKERRLFGGEILGIGASRFRFVLGS